MACETDLRKLSQRKKSRPPELMTAVTEPTGGLVRIVVYPVVGLQTGFWYMVSKVANGIMAR